MSTNNMTPHEMAHENLYSWTSAEEMHAATGLTLAECHEIMHDADVSRALGNVAQLCDMAASETDTKRREALTREAATQLATLEDFRNAMRAALASAEASRTLEPGSVEALKGDWGTVMHNENSAAPKYANLGAAPRYFDWYPKHIVSTDSAPACGPCEGVEA